jgi:hypothetical protein
LGFRSASADRLLPCIDQVAQNTGRHQRLVSVRSPVAAPPGDPPLDCLKPIATVGHPLSGRANVLAKPVRAVPDQPVLRPKSVTAAHDAMSDGKVSGSIKLSGVATTDFAAAFRLRVSLAFFAASLRFLAAALAFLVAAAFTAASLRFLASAFAFLVAAALFAAALRFLVAAACFAAALRSAALFIARSITAEGPFLVHDFFDRRLSAFLRPTTANRREIVRFIVFWGGRTDFVGPGGAVTAGSHLTESGHVQTLTARR